MEYLKIAWRNLWRNRRRTLITSSSIMFAVFFAIVMRSFQLGTYDHMINNLIESFSGYIQVNDINYPDDMTLENSIEFSPELLSGLDNLDEIKAVVPRIESFALASSGILTKGALVIGIDPEREKDLSDPDHMLVRYRFTNDAVQKLKSSDIPKRVTDKIEVLKNESYSSREGVEVALGIEKEDLDKWMPKILESGKFECSNLNVGDSGVLVSDRLSKFLKIDIGDTLILIGQGYEGISAAGLFPVRGIVKIPAPDLDNKLIFMSLPMAQGFYNMVGRVTSININPADNSDKKLNKTKSAIASAWTGQQVAIRDWKEFNTILKQQIEGDNQSGQLMLGLLYFIIFFGIFGTVLMMIHERAREFGVLIAIGMQRLPLSIIVIYEMVLMGLMAVIAGIALSLPILYYGYRNPIRFTGDMAKVYTDMGFDPVMPLMWIDTYVFWQALVVAFMVIFSCLYPLRKIFTMKEINALRA